MFEYFSMYSQVDIERPDLAIRLTAGDFIFPIFYSFPVLQMGSRVASTSTSTGSSSADSQSASSKALFPSTSQVRSCLPAPL